MDRDHIMEFLRDRPRAVIQRDDLMKAGVLMLLFPKDSELHVLLTKRTSEVEHHKGQISFPGGSVDQSDSDIVMTALREAEEEIGLPGDSVEVLGLFDDIWTPSGFCITPVIGYAAFLPVLTPSAVEVEEILEVPLSVFLKRENETVKKLQRSGTWIEVYFYRHGNNEIWGATAAMVRSFLQAFKTFAQAR